jgi:AAHS family 4-hydroxybenzoate transporter-like MFS transporter
LPHENASVAQTPRLGETAMNTGKVDVGELIDQHRFSWRQILIVALCTVLMMLDGFDGMEIAYVAPSLMREWHLAPTMLSLVFTASSVAAIVGSLVIGPLADRHGRRWMTIGGTVLMGVGSLMGAFATGPNEFLAWRILGGLGLAAVMPNAIAIGAEFAPTRARSFAVITLYSGYAIGASIGAGIAAQLIPTHGWQIVMIIGGVAPLLIAVALVPLLPESIRFLVAVRPGSIRIPKLLRRIDPAWNFAPDAVFVTTEPAPTGTPVRALFRDGRAAVTLLLWVIFTMNIMELIFLSSWTPTLIHSAGVPLDWALNVSMVMQAGALAGALLMARGMDKFGPYVVLIGAHALGVVAVGSFGFSIGMGPAMFIAGALMGAGIMGTQTAMFGLVAGVYPTSMRATGVGSALGVGRFGAIAGPLIGGAMVSAHLPAEQIYLLAIVPPVISTIAIVTLWRRSRTLVPGEQAPDLAPASSAAE